MYRMILSMLVVMVLAAGCSKSGPQPASPTGPTGGTAPLEVGINGDAYLPTGTAAFAPNNITVDRGTTVNWKNNDQTTHTSTANSGLWASSVNAGGTYSRQFTAAGSYEYHCAIHPYMTGSVIVR